MRSFYLSLLLISVRMLSYSQDWLPIPLNAMSNYYLFIGVNLAQATPLRIDSITMDSTGIEYGIFLKEFDSKWHDCVQNGNVVDSTRDLVFKFTLFQKFKVTPLSIFLYRDGKTYHIPYNVPLYETRSFNDFCWIRYSANYTDQFLGKTVEIREFELKRKSDGSFIGFIKLTKDLGIISMPWLPFLEKDYPTYRETPLLGIEYDSGDVIGQAMPSFGDDFRYAVGDILTIHEIEYSLYFPYHQISESSYSVPVTNIDTTNGNYILELGIDWLIDLTLHREMLRASYIPTNTLRQSPDGNSWIHMFTFVKHQWDEFYGFMRYYGDSCAQEWVRSYNDTTISKEYGLWEWGSPLDKIYHLEKIEGQYYNYTLGNDELFPSKREFEVFPNPAQDFLNLSGFNENATVRIFNTSGVLVLSDRASISTSLDISDLPVGVYFLKIEMPDGDIQHQKFVKN